MMLKWQHKPDRSSNEMKTKECWKYILTNSCQFEMEGGAFGPSVRAAAPRSEFGGLHFALPFYNLCVILPCRTRVSPTPPSTRSTWRREKRSNHGATCSASWEICFAPRLSRDRKSGKSSFYRIVSVYNFVCVMLSLRDVLKNPAVQELTCSLGEDGSSSGPKTPVAR